MGYALQNLQKLVFTKYLSVEYLKYVEIVCSVPQRVLVQKGELHLRGWSPIAEPRHIDIRKRWPQLSKGNALPQNFVWECIPLISPRHTKPIVSGIIIRRRDRFLFLLFSFIICISSLPVD